MFYLLLLPIAWIGHAFFWIGCANRLHALEIRHAVLKPITGMCFLTMGVGPTLDLASALFGLSQTPSAALWRGEPFSLVPVLSAYLIFCWTIAAVTIGRWLAFIVFYRTPDVVRFVGCRKLDLHLPSRDDPESENRNSPSAYWPYNQALSLTLTELTVEPPRLPAELDGLTILHATDFHFTGLICKRYFQEMTRAANDLNADCTLLTGDVVDNLNCVPWIGDTLGKLRSRYGVYFVLGNHDSYRNPKEIRSAMIRTGLIDLGGRWQYAEFRDKKVLLAGNERPWFDWPADSPAIPRRDSECEPFRVALAHSPDQMRWAQKNDMDLLFCGHTHGGQICVPPLGPILTPSFNGVRYSRGLFYNEPTLTFVSRGISGEEPVRWNCPPEITLMTLRAK